MKTHRHAPLNFRKFPGKTLEAIPSGFQRWLWLFTFLVMIPYQGAIVEVLPGYLLHFNFIHSHANLGGR